MEHVSVSREVAASPEDIWACLADAGRWPEWMPGVTRSEVTNGQPGGVGRRQRLDVSYGGRQGEIELEITQWEPLRRIAWVHLADPFQAAGKKVVRELRTVVTLEREGDGTRLSIEGTWEPVGLAAKMLSRTLVAPRASGMLEQAAENLERLAGRSPPA